MKNYKLHDYLTQDSWYCTQGYGINAGYYSQFNLLWHEGTDFGNANKNIEVKALHDGVIIQDWDIEKGNYGGHVVVWDDVQLIATWYNHLELNNNVNLGQRVRAGEVLGEMGTTGNSSGEHLHLNFVITDKNGNRLYKKREMNWGLLDPMHPLDPNLPKLPPGVPGYDISWILPNSMTETIDDLDSCMADREKFWKERDEYQKKFEEQLGKNTKLQQEFDQYKSESEALVNDLKREKSASETEAKEYKVANYELLRDLANMLNTTQQKAQILSEVEKMIDFEDEGKKAIDDLRQEKLERKHTETELNNTIANLQAVVDNMSFDDLTIEQMFRKLIAKIIKIIKE